MRADLLLRGGRVFTADPASPFAEAVAIQGDRVLAVGDERAVRDTLGPGTRVLELEGRLALPGFHDAHTHALGAGLLAQELDLERETTPEACAARVAARARERPGDWVLGRGWDADRFPGGAWPHRALLDAAAPGVPVFLVRRDGHAAWASGRALALAGIGPGRADPPHGKIGRGPGGELTGILLEAAAIDLVRSVVPAPSLARRVEAAARSLALAREHGVTSLQDDASYDDRLEPARAYGALLERGELTARVTLWQRLGRPVEDLRAERAALPPSGDAPRLAFGMLKGFLDGSLGSRTAHLCDPYSDDPAHGCGIALLEPAELSRRVALAHEAGFQVGLHAIGDRAVARALDAYESLARAGDPGRVRAARHRVEHAQHFRPADVARLGALGAVASVQPIHLAKDSRIAPARLGPERCRTSYPWRALLEAGAPLAFGTDYPVEGIVPLRGVFCAVARRDPDEPGGPAFHPEQALGLAEALAAYTAGSAFAAHQERALGRLAPGFLADVAVLSRDPFAVEPGELPGIVADVTILGGEVVFERV